jgi:hypothetical protein
VATATTAAYNLSGAWSGHWPADYSGVSQRGTIESVVTITAVNVADNDFTVSCPHCSHCGLSWWHHRLRLSWAATTASIVSTTVAPRVPEYHPPFSTSKDTIAATAAEQIIVLIRRIIRSVVLHCTYNYFGVGHSRTHY